MAIKQCNLSEFLKIIADEGCKTNSVSKSVILLTEDGSCIKAYDDPRIINVKKIITSDDYDLDNLVFPTLLYADMNYKDDYLDGNLLFGYKSDYIKNDFLVNLNSSVEYLLFDDFEDAYRLLIKDVDVLSKDKILLCNLDGNLLYNGEKLVAVDTIDYGLKKGYSKVFDYKGGMIKGYSNYLAKEWDYSKLNRLLVDEALRDELYLFSGNDAFRECKNFNDIKATVKDEYGSSKKIKRKEKKFN